MPHSPPDSARLLLVDEPYVSPFLRKTIHELKLPLVLTPAAKALGFTEAAHTLTEEQAIEIGRSASRLLVYTSSENCLGWLSANLPESPLAVSIRRFKDKALFRELTTELAPDYFFRRVDIAEVGVLANSTLPLPVILKPSVGFFSMGVRRIENASEWQAAQASIVSEQERFEGLYPEDVLGKADFLIEACIEGDEFAIDAYLDASGAPVLLGIWKHAFASENDMGDRLYSTSGALIEKHLAEFTDFLANIARLTGAKDIPIHVELRCTDTGVLRAIEVNPMRFGGWCTTADATQLAYGHNPYQLFFEQGEPNWTSALQKLGHNQFSIVVLNNSTGIDGSEVKHFDYDGLLARFTRPIELRKTDFARFPLFGFLFLETSPEDADELDWILHTDLCEFTA